MAFWMRSTSAMSTPIPIIKRPPTARVRSSSTRCNPSGTPVEPQCNLVRPPRLYCYCRNGNEHVENPQQDREQRCCPQGGGPRFHVERLDRARPRWPANPSSGCSNKNPLVDPRIQHAARWRERTLRREGPEPWFCRVGQQ